MAAIDQAMLDYITSLGSGSASVGALPTDPAEQGDWLGDAKKYGGLNADLSYQIGQNNLMPGAYDQVPVFNPLKNASGYNQLAQWSNGTPFQRWVAQQIQGDPATGEGAADAMTIQSRLAALMAAPDAPGAADIIASLPPMLDRDTGQPLDQPDVQKAFDTIEGLTTAISQSDPWDYQTFDPATGAPATMGLEDSAALQKLRDLGYTTTPGETFDPYSVAPQGTYERDQGISGALQQAMASYQLAQDQARQAVNQAKSAQTVSEGWQPGGVMDSINAQKRQATEDAGFPSLPDNRSWAEKAAGAVGGAIKKGGEAVLNTAAVPLNSTLLAGETGANLFRGPNDQWNLGRVDYPDLVGQGASGLYNAMDTGESLTASERAARQRTGGRSAADAVAASVLRANDQGRANRLKKEASAAGRAGFQADQKRRSTKKDYISASNNNLASQYQQAMREAYVQHLAQNGLTPFDLENRQRMGY